MSERVCEGSRERCLAELYSLTVAEMERYIDQKYQCCPEVIAGLQATLRQQSEANRDRILQEQQSIDRLKTLRRRFRRALRLLMLDSFVRAEKYRKNEFAKALQAERHRAAARHLEALKRYQQAIETMLEEVVKGQWPPAGWRPQCSVNTRDDPAYKRLWKGADVYLVLEPIDHYRGSKTIFATPHAFALHELFLRLRDCNRASLNHMNKYEFYGRMAEAVNELMARQPQASRAAVLLAAIRAAEKTVERWIESLETELKSEHSS